MTWVQSQEHIQKWKKRTDSTICPLTSRCVLWHVHHHTYTQYMWTVIIVRTQSKNGIVQEEFWLLLSKLQENKTLVLRPPFLQKHRNAFKMCFVLFPVVADSSEFSLDCSTGYCYLFASMGKACFCDVWLVFVIIDFTHVALLNPQCTNYLMLWIELAVAWDFSLFHFRLHSPTSLCLRATNCSNYNLDHCVNS